MLIKNEISFKGIIGHQNYGSVVMIILYILSLFGCVLIAIIILKLIISCFFTERFKLFCITSDQNVVKTGDECNISVRSSSIDGNHITRDSLNGQTVSHLGNILVKLSQTQISLGEKQQCICPICANGHTFPMSGVTDKDVVNREVVVAVKTPIPAKRSSFIRKSVQKLRTSSMEKKRNAIQMDLIKALDKSFAKNMTNMKTNTVPMVSKTQSERIIVKKKDKSVNDIKQMANYSDVVLELKQRFSSMTALNTTV